MQTIHSLRKLAETSFNVKFLFYRIIKSKKLMYYWLMFNLRVLVFAVESSTELLGDR